MNRVPPLSLDGKSVRVRRATTRSDLRKFLAVPHRVFSGDPVWIPPLTRERLRHLDPRRNPFFSIADVRFWIGERDGIPIGRLSAQTCRDHRADNKIRAHFGFVDAVDDPAVFSELFANAETWLKEQGAHSVTGPFSLSINEESGLLVDGFDRAPFLMMGHAAPYYAGHLERLGYRKQRDLLAYRFDPAMDTPPSVRAFVAKVKREAGVTFRALDLADLTNEIARVMNIFNDAWADNWHFVPFSQKDMSYVARNVRPLLRADDVAIAEIDGEPVAMALSLPNVNEAIADLRGRLFPFGWAKLLWRLKVTGLRTARMPLMGVLRRYRGSALSAGLALGVIEQVRRAHCRRGTREAELSWVLEDNLAVRRLIEMLGGVACKTYRIYGKELG